MAKFVNVTPIHLSISLVFTLLTKNNVAVVVYQLKYCSIMQKVTH